MQRHPAYSNKKDIYLHSFIHMKEILHNDPLGLSLDANRLHSSNNNTLHFKLTANFYHSQPRITICTAAANHSFHFKQTEPLCRKEILFAGGKETSNGQWLKRGESCFKRARFQANSRESSWPWQQIDIEMQRRQAALPIHACMSSIRSESTRIIPGADRTRVCTAMLFFHIWDTTLLFPSLPVSLSHSLSASLSGQWQQR